MKMRKTGMNIEAGSTAAQERDVLGRVYEYFLSKLASAEGKLGGEFSPLEIAESGTKFILT